MNRSHSLGGSTLFLAAALILSLYAVACGSERGEGADPDGAAPETTAVARGSGSGVPPSPPIECAMFPDDSYWHADVSQLPVHRDSDTFIGTIGTDTTLFADFGAGLYEGSRIGIPYTVVGGDQPGVDVSFDVPDESDAGPYPIPEDAPIEGGPEFVEDGDRHVLVIERDSCTLYELFASEPRSDGTWNAFSGAVFDLGSNDLRPDTFTSADAAGLPILPGLARYDEVAAGEIDHAIRFTVEATRDEYVWPARHQAGEPGDDLPPMGLWLRLKADFDTSGYPEELQVILRAMQKHGLILADNGSSMFISGTPDDRWDNDKLALLREITADNFEAVDVSSLITDPDSGRIRQ
ncbi:MAG: hypothetical protein ACRDSJ_22490 [Rubrobacteraceae bacterium]